ncbi:MAG: hypothetical protein HFI82_00170 [Eubacterium sp.]|jgi:HPt (histidine-containing phosphotransfer) domain-containing protein|nr:hypothetical protein [Eubacterium sp.]
MALLEELKSLGVNVEEGLKRLNGNEKLYTRLFGSFLKTINANMVSVDFDCTDYTETTEKVHTMKGTAGNLSVTPLYEGYSEILALLRSGQPEQAKPILEKILPIQEEIIKCIERNLE